MKLAGAAVTLIADASTAEECLTYFGRCFIRAAGAFKYETLIKVNRRYLSFCVCIIFYL